MSCSFRAARFSSAARLGFEMNSFAVPNLVELRFEMNSFAVLKYFCHLRRRYIEGCLRFYYVFPCSCTFYVSMFPLTTIRWYLLLYVDAYSYTLLHVSLLFYALPCVSTSFTFSSRVLHFACVSGFRLCVYFTCVSGFRLCVYFTCVSGLRLCVWASLVCP